VSRDRYARTKKARPPQHRSMTNPGLVKNTTRSRDTRESPMCEKNLAVENARVTEKAFFCKIFSPDTRRSGDNSQALLKKPASTAQPESTPTPPPCLLSASASQTVVQTGPSKTDELNRRSGPSKLPLSQLGIAPCVIGKASSRAYERKPPRLKTSD
jgi:hypothetical protein